MCCEFRLNLLPRFRLSCKYLHGKNTLAYCNFSQKGSSALGKNDTLKKGLILTLPTKIVLKNLKVQFGHRTQLPRHLFKFFSTLQTLSKHHRDLARECLGFLNGKFKI